MVSMVKLMMDLIANLVYQVFKIWMYLQANPEIRKNSIWNISWNMKNTWTFKCKAIILNRAYIILVITTNRFNRLLLHFNLVFLGMKMLMSYKKTLKMNKEEIID